MALFESYERRIDQINAVLNSYGISSIEEAEKITKDAGLELQKLLQLSVKVFRHSVFQVQLLTRERLVLDMVTLVRCFLKKIQNVSLS